MTKVQVFDNFMNKFKFKELQDQILAPTFSWNVGNVVRPGTADVPDKYNVQITHLFYQSPSIISEAMPVIAPLLADLDMEIFMRAKANCTFATDKVVEHGMHVDVEPDGLAKLTTTAIFYINTNDGYSVFEDGTKVESIENRLVTFPATMLHSGSSCTNASRRVVLNLNYIGKM